MWPAHVTLLYNHSHSVTVIIINSCQNTAAPSALVSRTAGNRYAPSASLYCIVTLN
jgi:hypothetical protein